MKKRTKMINIAYFWHVKLSPDHNICLIQEFNNIQGVPFPKVAPKYFFSEAFSFSFSFSFKNKK